MASHPRGYRVTSSFCLGPAGRSGRVAHRLERRLAAGPALEGQRALSHEHLEAIHDRGAARLRPGRERRLVVPVDELHGKRGRRRSRRPAGPRSTSPGCKPTDVALTTSSAATGASTVATSRSAASMLARSGVLFQTLTSAPASRSAHAAARPAPPAPSTSAVIPRTSRGSAASRPAASVLSAWMRAVGERQRVGSADRARGVARLVGERERRLLVRDRDVRAAVAGSRQRADGLGEELGRDRQLHVTPVEPERLERRVVDRGRAAVPDRVAQDADQRQHSVGDFPPCAARSAS